MCAEGRRGKEKGEWRELSERRFTLISHFFPHIPSLLHSSLLSFLPPQSAMLLQLLHCTYTFFSTHDKCQVNLCTLLGVWERNATSSGTSFHELYSRGEETALGQSTRECCPLFQFYYVKCIYCLLYPSINNYSISNVHNP